MSRVERRAKRREERRVELNVVRDVRGVQPVSQKRLLNVSPLLLSAGVDWDRTRFENDQDAQNELMLLENRVR